jgi:hypothetical protein
VAGRKAGSAVGLFRPDSALGLRSGGLAEVDPSAVAAAEVGQKAVAEACSEAQREVAEAEAG